MPAARDALRWARIGSPIALLTVFLIAFIVSSIISARRLTPNGKPASGPGGRPLPKRTRSAMVVARDRQEISPTFRSVFKWLSVGVLVTLVVDAVANITQALLFRSVHWWRGQPVVVSARLSWPSTDIR
jgi:hypothetical protein